MIFVTVGNATQPFMRLLEAVERLAAQCAFAGEEVFVQSGSNRSFVPIHCNHSLFLSPEEFQAKIEAATVIICHAGAGTLLHVFQAGKVPVVMPRQKRYRELIDDHQMELTKVLAAEGRVIPAYETEDLPAAIAEVRKFWGEVRKPAAVRLIELVRETIEEIVQKGSASRFGDNRK